MLNVGVDYIRHDGGGPDFNKGILTAPSVNFSTAAAAWCKTSPWLTPSSNPWSRARC